jgi:hypothetical protein
MRSMARMREATETLVYAPLVVLTQDHGIRCAGLRPTAVELASADRLLSGRRNVGDVKK